MRKMLLALAMLPLSVFMAASLPATAFAACANEGSFLGFPRWYQYLEREDRGGSCEITGPMDGDKFDWQSGAGLVALAVVEIALRIGSLVVVGFVIYGGIKYILTQGDPEKAKTARQTIVNALVGLVIAIAASAIVAFIGNRLGN